MQRRTFLKSGLAVPIVGSAGSWQDRSSSAHSGAQGSPGFADFVQRARQAALDVLKPSKRDLEYGLALHRQSVVIDVYGFSPRAALDVEAYSKAVEDGASNVELTDLREEMSMIRCVTSPEERAEYKAAWETSGVTAVVQNAGEENQAALRIMRRLARFTYVTDMLRDFVFKAAVPQEIVQAKKEGRHALYFSANAVPLQEQWVDVRNELELIRVFYQLGIRMMHLTYNRRNMIGDGCAEKTNAGLSDFGRAVVAEMNRVGVIVDVAHSGWQTGLDAAAVSTRPIVASHTACDALNHHIRCKPDNVLRAIAETGGLVGICCIPAFLGGNGDIAALLDHIQYAARVVGVDHVAVGTDTAHQSRYSEGQDARLPRSQPARPYWENFWPPNALSARGNRLSLAWTNWPLFTVGLVQRGFSDRDIRKILGGNFIRVAEAVLPRLDVA